ncbi:MAG: hypothetical protein M1819_006206 [Sarea resinae]|nr:MAG: hypothetical protein M1819_006206 [Sarea resinae]
MSLYYEAASILEAPKDAGGSLKSRIYNNNNNDKKFKSTPAHLYALISETTKWSAVLSDVIEKAQILDLERKLTPLLAVLLVHDLLLAKRGIAAPTAHALRAAVEKHRARLGAEFTKIRIKRGFATLEAFRAHISGGLGGSHENNAGEGDDAATSSPKVWKHARWVRVNTLRTTLSQQLETTFSDYRHVDSIREILTAAPTDRLLHVDRHIPNLLALPPGADLSATPAYKQGHIIFQDKASCFPAYLLDPQADEDEDENENENENEDDGDGNGNGDVIDACAAPGNKTSHIAAILSERPSNSRKSGRKSKAGPSKVWACERDKTRATTLQKMIARAGATDMVTVKPGQDFLRLDPHDPTFARVGALLLDPSCSGSGIVGRDDVPVLVLPRRGEGESKDANTSTGGKGMGKGLTGKKNGKKRKRGESNNNNDSTRSNDEKPILRVNLPVLEDEEQEQEQEQEEQPPPAAAAAATPPNELTQGAAAATSPNKLTTRLTALSTFQLRLLLHAMAFPAATRITYSTCSVHVQENEAVVARALRSAVATARGWRVLRRAEQVAGMRAWDVRGESVVVGDADADGAGGGAGSGTGGGAGDSDEEFSTAVADACLRCYKGGPEGTMGFFVAGLVRDEASLDRVRAGEARLNSTKGEEVGEILLRGDVHEQEEGEEEEEEEEKGQEGEDDEDEWAGFSNPEDDDDDDDDSRPASADPNPDRNLNSNSKAKAKHPLSAPSNSHTQKQKHRQNQKEGGPPKRGKKKSRRRE